MNFLGISDQWPETVSAWMNDPQRRDVLAEVLCWVGAALILAHAQHAWSRGGDLDFIRETEAGNERRRIIEELNQYNAGRSLQTFASIWVVTALAAEVAALDAVVWGLLLSGLVLGTALSLRDVGARDRLEVAISAIAADAVGAAVVLLSLPLQAFGRLIKPGRSPSNETSQAEAGA